MEKSRKENLSSDPAYVDLVATFKQKRKMKGVKQKAIDLMAGSGHGKVSMFEALKSTPTLYTFVKWCTEAGIDISLRLGTRGARLRAKKALEAKRKEMNDPGRIIDQLKKERNQKSKINHE